MHESTALKVWEYMQFGSLFISQDVSFLYDDMYKSIRYLWSYSSSSIPEATAFRVVMYEEGVSTTDVLT